MTTYMQPPLPTGAELRDEGMARAEAHASFTWKAAALAAIHLVCEKRLRTPEPFFTADAVWYYLDKWATPPPEPRALGPMMTRAQRMGWITPTPNFVPTTRPSAHGSPSRIWRVCTPLPPLPNDIARQAPLGAA